MEPLRKGTARLIGLPDRLFFPLIMGVLALLALFPAWLRPGRMIAANDFSQFYFWEIQVREGFRAGGIPQWTPYILGGYPTFANPEFLSLYPLAIPLRLLPIHLAFTVGITLHLWLAGWGMAAVSRQGGLTRAGALLSGGALMLGGFLAPRIAAGHLTVIYSMGWFPWALLAWMKLVEGPRSFSRVLALAAAMGMQFLAGSPNVLTLTAFTLGLLTLDLIVTSLLTHSHTRLVRTVASLLGATLLMVGLTAFQLLPTLELAGLSSRAGGSDLACQAPFSMTLSDFRTLISGTPAPETFLSWEKAAYGGAIALLIALLGLANRPSGDSRHLKRRALILLGVGLLLSFGPGLPFYSLLYRIVPGLQVFRVPARFILLALVGLAWLAGLGVDALYTEGRPANRPILLLLALVFGGIALAVEWRSLPQALWLIQQVAASGSAGVPALIFAGSDAVRAVLLISAWRYLLLALVLAILLWRGQTRPIGPLALTFALLDLWGYALPHLRLIDPARLTERTEALPAIPISEGRRLTVPYLYANEGIASGVADAQGYAPLVLESVYAFASYPVAEGDCQDFEHADFRPDDFATLRAASVVEVVDVDGRLAMPVEGERVAGMRVYPVADPLPRLIWTADVIEVDSLETAVRAAHDPGFDPARSVVLEAIADFAPPAEPAVAYGVSFLAYEPHHILIEIDAPADGMLILNDTYYPGWTATVNSVDTAIVRANGVWRGVAVPAGNSVVEMRYRSRYLTLGSVISGLSLLVGVAGLFLERNKIVLP